MSTRAQLRTRVRAYLDETVQKYWLDSEINNWITQSYAYYYQWIIMTFDGYFAKDVLINIVANDPKITLPADFFKVRLLERVLTDKTVPMKPFDRMETANITANANFGNDLVPTYRFEGQFILMEPTPDSNFTNGLRLEYYPIPSTLPADNSTLDAGYLVQWEEPIVLRAAISAKQKEEAVANTGSDIAPLQKALQEWEQVIKESAQQRTVNRRYTEVFGIWDGEGL